MKGVLIFKRVYFMLSLCVLFTACASQLDENAQYDSLVKEVTVSVNNLKVQDFLSSDVE